jgi:hypothetical protein
MHAVVNSSTSATPRPLFCDLRHRVASERRANTLPSSGEPLPCTTVHAGRCHFLEQDAGRRDISVHADSLAAPTPTSLQTGLHGLETPQHLPSPPISCCRLLSSPCPCTRAARYKQTGHLARVPLARPLPTPLTSLHVSESPKTELVPIFLSVMLTAEPCSPWCSPSCTSLSHHPPSSPSAPFLLPP